ncbi:glycoside hydrolase family 76 protein [Saccharata proteae CBS 121410]|uniref:Mannan endo-1,6-alpha-mannosidase n=1 Tax=Saccharata proteae CBS 121410 TaxID=1314787 RepID=A0A6A5YCC9_9PEZI|nr:glycoside hydrolase family 76 protein [Saccharata proteae CBS 121410]
MLNGASCAGVVATLLLQRSSALDINVNDHDSIRSAAGIVANDLMSLYVNNGNTTPAYLVGTFAKPVYWWEAGAAWGGMVDYWSYTNDETYVASTKQALLFQAGPSNDFMNDQWKKELGNDDQSFWALTAMTAAEQNFPAADTGNPSWLDMAVRVFESQIARWDTSTCGGGLRWQIYPENNGYNYKNSVSNGGLFQLAARLFRYTGNSTYSDWANRIWDWSTSVDFVDSTYNVYDGASDQDGCDPVDKLQWTYNLGLYLYGTANMWNATEGTVQAWHTRTQGLVDSASIFFGQASNSTNVMYEAACEPNGMCDTDQRSFKAYLSRWMGKTSVLCPWTTSQVLPKLRASAEGAAEACSGGVDGKTCGAKWYIGGFDGITGVGEQLSALEVFDALLAGNSPGPAVQSDSALFANVITVTKTSGASQCPHCLRRALLKLCPHTMGS